jgi:Plavaka transposase
MVDIIKDKELSQERTQIFHNQLSFIMQPIFNVMKDGVNLLCGDGKRRWCFPRLAAFMGDYEEAWRVCGVRRNYCVVCTMPSLRAKDVDPALDRKNCPPRTGTESLQLRTLYKDQPEILKQHGYQSVNLFTDEACFPGCSIYDAIAPDLLHQASKNFHDQVFAKWRKAVLKLGATEATLAAELDARFQHVPTYPGLRWFRNGISKLKRWTGTEYKGMMRVWMGVSRGLGGDILNSMVKEYLDIHRLAHYPSHSDAILGASENTLSYLEKAVDGFFRHLHDSDGPLVQFATIDENYMTNKLHAMYHYTTWIRAKGTLPQYSTDRTEALHRLYKTLYRASNRGHDVAKFVCENEWRIIGMLMFNEELRQDALREKSERHLRDPINAPEEDGAELDEEDGGEREPSNETLDDRDYDRLYEWEMLLDEDETEFEYLGDEDQTEEAKAKRREKELREVEGRRKKHEVGVRFTGLGVKKLSGYELEEAAVKLGLEDKDFVNQTLRTLCWIKDGRDAGRKGRRGATITMVGVERIFVTKVFEGIECVRATVLRPDVLVREIHRCTDKYFLAANRNWVEPRHDTVLVNYDRAENETEVMVGRRIARLWCLFTVDVLENPSLALVQWFDIRRETEPVTNMYVVNKTNRYEVIELLTIERGVHLIPDFGRIGTTQSPLEGDNNRLRGLDAYDRFVLNNYTDLDAYNNYY